MSTEIETTSGGGVLAIRPGQTEWTPMQQAALGHMGIVDAPAEDQMVFLHHCQRTGLDPFAKQVYMIGREGDVKRKNERGATIVERGTIYTIQTGIDGYRLIGERAARAHGDTVEHTDPLWRGKPGSERDEWTDYWPDGAGAPAACKYVIKVNGVNKTAIVNFHEFAQFSGRGELTPMWKKMPANQLAVRAEAQAWRKAYPADFSGIGLEGDPQHHTVIDAETGEVQGKPAQQRRTTGRGVAGLEEAISQAPASSAPSGPTADQVVEGEVVEPQQSAGPNGPMTNAANVIPGSGGITKAQYEACVAGLDKLFDGGEGRAAYVRAAVKRDVEHLKQLTSAEGDELLLIIAEHTAERAMDDAREREETSAAADDKKFS